MKNIGELRDAADIYEHVYLANPMNNNAKMELAAIYEISGDEEGFEVVIGSRKKRKTNPTTPSSDIPASSTTEDLTITSLFAEAKSLNMSKVKPSAGVKPRLTPAQLRALEVKKEKEVGRGGGGTMRLGGNVEGGGL